MPDKVIERLGKWLAGRDYKAFHESPLGAEAENLKYWTKSDKHKRRTERDSDFFRCYVMFALAASAPFSARGINIPRKGFVYRDVAVMNSCLNAGMVALDDGQFKLTEEGLSHLGLVVPS
jgi:hypothetical protein